MALSDANKERVPNASSIRSCGPIRRADARRSTSTHPHRRHFRHGPQGSPALLDELLAHATRNASSIAIAGSRATS